MSDFPSFRQAACLARRTRRAWGARVDAVLPDERIVRGIRRDKVEPRVPRGPSPHAWMHFYRTNASCAAFVATTSSHAAGPGACPRKLFVRAARRDKLVPRDISTEKFLRTCDSSGQSSRTTSFLGRALRATWKSNLSPFPGQASGGMGFQLGSCRICFDSRHPSLRRAMPERRCPRSTIRSRMISLA